MASVPLVMQGGAEQGPASSWDLAGPRGGLKPRMTLSYSLKLEGRQQ